MIKLGNDDIILKTKLKDITGLELVENLNAISDMSIKWPNVDVKEVTNLPKGTHKKNIHSLSSSSDSDSPEIEKHKSSKEKNSDNETSLFHKIQTIKRRCATTFTSTWRWCSATISGPNQGDDIHTGRFYIFFFQRVSSAQ